MSATALTLVVLVAVAVAALGAFALARMSAQLAQANARLGALRDMRAEAEQTFTQATDRIVSQARDTLVAIAEERFRGTQADAQGRIAEMVAPFQERLTHLTGSIEALNRARADDAQRLAA